MENVCKPSENGNEWKKQMIIELNGDKRKMQ